MLVTEWAEALEELSEHLGASLCREESWDEGQQAILGLVTVFPPGLPMITAQQMQGHEETLGGGEPLVVGLLHESSPSGAGDEHLCL